MIRALAASAALIAGVVMTFVALAYSIAGSESCLDGESCTPVANAFIMGGLLLALAGFIGLVTLYALSRRRHADR